MTRYPVLLVLLAFLLLAPAACRREEEVPFFVQLPPAPTGAPAGDPVSPRLVPTRSPHPTQTVAPAPLQVVLAEDYDLEAYPPSAPLVFVFNQPVDTEGVARPVVISPHVSGETTWDEAGVRLTFTPNRPLRPNNSFVVTIAGALRSVSGQKLPETARWRLHTQRVPSVRAIAPAQEQIDERQPTIRVIFSELMDRGSVEAALHVSPTLAYETAWQESMLFIEVVEPMALSSTYEFSIDSTATNEQGVHLLTERRWRYQLESPLHLSGWPNSSDPQGPIRLFFTYGVDPADLGQVVRFVPSMEGEWSWDGENRVATFEPTSRLLSGTDYTVRFAGDLRLPDGTPLALPEALHFSTPPPVVSALPAGDHVDATSPIRIRFDRPMDQAATEAAFAITPAVAGAFEWDETALIFRPESGYLAVNTEYTVTLSPEAVDAAGEPILDEAYSWTFTTGELERMATFGWGPNAQVLDASGRRAVHFQVLKEPGVLEFELYDMTLDAFLERYASGFRGAAGWYEEPPSISVDGLPLHASWQSDMVAGDVQEVIIPDDVRPGLYLLNLNAGRLNDQLLLVLSDNTLMVKQAGEQLVAWVSDINGDALPGTPVSVYARNGNRLDGGQTNANGVYRTTLPAFTAGGPPSLEPLIVVAGSGRDLTISGLSPEWRTGGWWSWWRPQPALNDYSAYIYSERPIYKPGQTVHFKAIIREDADAVLSLPPSGTPVSVRLRDARNNVVQTLALETNNFGSIHSSFDLAEGAMLGTYAIELVVDGETHRQSFKVEDYRKPDFEVIVHTNPMEFVAGDTIEVVVEADYYFGEPVVGAGVTIQRYFLEQSYDWWSGEPGEATWYPAGANAGISGRTNASGRFTTTVTAVYNRPADSYSSDWGSSNDAMIWALEATVNDGSNQTVSGFAQVEIFNAEAGIELDTSGYLHEPEEPFAIEAKVRTISGEPVAGQELTLELRRWERDTYDYTDVVQQAELVTDEQGQARLFFIVEEPGYYQLFVGGEEAQGNDISYKSWVYAFGDSFFSWFGRNDSAVAIAADQDRYAPGDTARLLIESTFDGPALLTFERGTTRRDQLVELTEPLTVVEVPLQVDDSPNIYVTVNAWEAQDTSLEQVEWQSIPDSRLHQATVNLSVPATTKQLNVNITADRGRYAPRDEATFTVRVTDYHGVPVSAELSLALVDEAIFALSEELSGPIYDGFYFERDNLVRTYHSMAPVRELFGGGRGGGGGGGAMPGGPRSDFPDTAAWLPTLETNADGEATVTLTLPDSLTTWRLTAKATTADTQVGEATQKVLTQQPIVVRPLLPRALTAGDTVQLSAVVHNYSGQEQTLLVSLEESAASSLEIAGTITQTITLAPDGVRVVGWPVEVLSAGETELLVVARADRDEFYGDAVLLPLTLHPLAVAQIETEAGQFDELLETGILLPEAALPLSTVEVQLSRSIAGSLLNGLDYLTGFPYGCVEQTMSRALPNAVVGRAFSQLGFADATLAADLPPRINASLQRLYGYQHDDGGWGWWYDDPSHDYQTAWVVFGLATTAEAGYEVSADVLWRGAAWLGANLDGMDPRTRAFALYSMALAREQVPEERATDITWSDDQPVEVDYTAAMESARRLQGPEVDLDVFARAALALALHHMGDSGIARTIVDSLVADVEMTEVGAFWPGAGEDGAYYRKTMASDVRNTALTLSALSRLRPGLPLNEEVARWLMSQRRHAGWGTTNETSFTIIGLTDHLLATSSESGGQTGYRLLLNGEEVASGGLDRGQPTVTIAVAADSLETGDNRLRVESTGRLYYVVNSRIYVPEKQIASSGVIEVKRTYFDGETGERLRRVQAGDLVKVEVTVDLPEAGSYMIVEDRLPGGLEALNEGLNTTSHAVSAVGEEPVYRWQRYGYNYKEIFGDRVSFFITELPAGRHTYTYYARATQAGTFTALPVEAYAMYDLAFWGRSASATVEIEGE